MPKTQNEITPEKEFEAEKAWNEECVKKAIISERKRLLEEVNKWREEIQQETGAFKYDFVFKGITNIINNK